MYNYGSYDTIAKIAEIDTKIKNEEFKTAKLNYNSRDTLANLGLVVKTALVAAAYFVKEYFTYLGLAVGSNIGKLFKIKVEKEISYDLELAQKQATLCGFQTINSPIVNGIIQPIKGFCNTILS